MTRTSSFWWHYWLHQPGRHIQSLTFIQFQSETASKGKNNARPTLEHTIMQFKAIIMTIWWNKRTQLCVTPRVTPQWLTNMPPTPSVFRAAVKNVCEGLHVERGGFTFFQQVRIDGTVPKSCPSHAGGVYALESRQKTPSGWYQDLCSLVRTLSWPLRVQADDARFNCHSPDGAVVDRRKFILGPSCPPFGPLKKKKKTKKFQNLQ